MPKISAYPDGGNKSILDYFIIARSGKNYKLAGTTIAGQYVSKAAAPTVNDDSSAGYGVGDMWIDETNDKSYIALDVTVGAAVWTEVTGAGGGGGGLEPESYWGNNIIRNYPSVEVANGIQPEFWEIVGDPTLTEEDATGESIPQIHERVLKLIISADGAGADFAYMDFDDVDEPTLDDNVTKVSAGCWVYQKSTDISGTITLELYDVDGTTSLGTATTVVEDAWTWLEINNVTYQDSMRWRIVHSVNSATIYVAMPCLNIGATVRPWAQRSTRYVGIDFVNVLSENPADTNWADLNLSAYLSSNAFMVNAFVQITGAAAYSGYLRPNGSSWTRSASVINPAGSYAGSMAVTLCDDQQVIEEQVNNSGVTNWYIAIWGYWEFS